MGRKGTGEAKTNEEERRAVVASGTVVRLVARMRAALPRQREFSPALRAFLAEQNSRVTRSLNLPAFILATNEAARCRFASTTI